MAGSNDCTNERAANSKGVAKPVWKTPQLEELGNLADFVRVGTNKSGAGMDATTSELRIMGG
jgi:hypothetical protein